MSCGLPLPTLPRKTRAIACGVFCVAGRKLRIGQAPSAQFRSPPSSTGARSESEKSTCDSPARKTGEEKRKRGSASRAIRWQLVGGLQQQPLDAAALDQVCLQHLVDVFLGRAAVPDAFRINHQVRSQLAAVEAAGVVDAHVLQPEVLAAGLHVVAQRLAVLLRAAAARMAGRAAVGAEEDMSLVVWLGITWLLT